MPLPIYVRFLIYGAAGCCFEIIFTGIKFWIGSNFQDWTFRGKSYIWMFPIYGLLAFLFEPVHDALRSVLWLFRGLIYVAGFFTIEFITGWILRVLTGKCPWDYSDKRYNFKGLIRWDYTPIWFGFCMVMELFHDLLMRVRIM
jgi:uncharacterized membrane protein